MRALLFCLLLPAAAIAVSCSADDACTGSACGGGGTGGTLAGGGSGGAGAGGSGGSGGEEGGSGGSPCLDEDGDGWTSCDGDCCDVPSAGCTDPAHVNPGAHDFAGDGIDDDCSGMADDAPQSCDQAIASDTTDAAELAAALDLCARTTGVTRGPGLLAASFELADGMPGPAAEAHAVRPSFGSIVPQRGRALAVLSTGRAAAKGQTAPAYAAFDPGSRNGPSSELPADWLLANGGAVPTAPGCPSPAGGSANDPVALHLQIRVPTNARSFSLSVFFLSSEFPEWVCSEYNDVFVALLGSAATDAPADENIAVYRAPTGKTFPVTVNLATGDTGLFTQCKNGETGCFGSVPGTISTCASVAQLAGTGFDEIGTGCTDGDPVGGGTGWLRIAGNVVPGETAHLRLALWDSGDFDLDSVVLLDDLRWGRDAVDWGAAP